MTLATSLRRVWKRNLLPKTFLGTKVDWWRFWLVRQLPRPSRNFLHHPRREGDFQVPGNGAMSAAGGESRKPLQNWPFVGSPKFSCRIQERFRLNRPTFAILQIRQYGDTRNALLVEFLYEYLWNNGIELTCLKKYTCPKRVFTGLLSFADM